jgi:uncharacterized membrane protein YgdD (TMEM256/DUF423 family)
MKKTAYISGAILGMLGVIMGAFGAHALEDILTSNGTLDTFQTGARYHMYHALFLLAVGVVSEFGTSKWLRLSTWFAIGGTVIFAGTLYLLAILNLRWMGAITPIGGLLLILGWFFLLLHIYQRKSNHE